MFTLYRTPSCFPYRSRLLSGHLAGRCLQLHLPDSAPMYDRKTFLRDGRPAKTITTADGFYEITGEIRKRPERIFPLDQHASLVRRAASETFQRSLITNVNFREALREILKLLETVQHTRRNCKISTSAEFTDRNLECPGTQSRAINSNDKLPRTVNTKSAIARRASRSRNVLPLIE